MSDKWAMVRVKRTTADQLHGLRALFQSQHLKGQLTDVPIHDRFGLSLDTVIQILIDRDDRHRERGRKQAIDKAKAALAQLGGGVPPDQPQPG